MITGSAGAFEVKVNDNLIYSKKTNGRHAEDGEVLKLFEEVIGPGVDKFGD